MCKFIFNLFSTTSKVISTTAKTVEVGLNVTNSTLEEVNKGLNKISNHLERNNILYSIARKVYTNEISKCQALDEVRCKLGIEANLEFENKLDKFREMDIKFSINQIFPLDISETYQSKDKVINTLTRKYGYIDEKLLEYYIKERREWIINFLSKSSKNNYRDLDDIELHKKFIKTLDELNKSVEKVDKLLKHI